MRAIYARTPNTALSRSTCRKSSDRMQGCSRRQADIRLTRLVGIHHCWRYRHRIDGLLRRGAWAGLCGPTVPQLIDDADNKLFNCVLYNEQHVLHPLLRERHRTVYSLSRDNRPLLPHWWMMDGKQWCFSCEFQLSATDDIYPDISVVLAVVDCRSVYCCVQRRDVHPQIITVVYLFIERDQRFVGL